MNFITKKSLARRTMLKGLGASLALPMLDSMLPALSAQTASIPRLGWMYVSHGVIFDQWKPAKVGANFELTPNLKPLEKLQGQFNILTGLSHLEADTKGEAPATTPGPPPPGSPAFTPMTARALASR